MKTIGPALCFAVCAALLVWPDSHFFAALCGFIGMVFFGLITIAVSID